MASPATIKRGRPPYLENARRDQEIKSYVTKAEKARLVARARDAGMSLSDYLRSELRPLMSTAEEALGELTAQGLATPGAGKLPPYTPVAAKRSAAALILAERDTERP